MPSVLLALPVFLLSLVLVPATPVQSWEDQVETQMAEIHAEIAADYDYASDLLIGELEPGDSYEFELDLNGDAEYIVVGVCDYDCFDLDLAIYDPYQDEAAADFEDDDFPVLEVIGEGSFDVEVLMPGCDAATCLWAVQVFVRE